MFDKAIDTQKLIEAVRKHKILYDNKHPDNSNVDFKDQIWLKIGKELDHPGSYCKKRWYSIRNTFRTSLRRRSSEKCKYSSRYKYEKHLEFLYDFCDYNVRYRDSQKKAIKSNDEEEDEEDVQFDENDTSNNIEYLDEDTVELYGSTSPITLGNLPSENQPLENLSADLKPKSFSNPIVAESLKMIEQYMDRIIEEEKSSKYSDPVDMFLAGLGPTLKSFSPLRLNMVKTKIFAIIQEAEMEVILEDQNQT